MILKRNQNRADLFNALSTFTSTSNSRSNLRSKISERNEGNDRSIMGNNNDNISSFNNELSIYSVVIDTKGISTKEFNDSEKSKDGSVVSSKLTLRSKTLRIGTRRRPRSRSRGGG